MIVWILRSRLHRLLSDGVLVLQFVGRKTGQVYRTPPSYVELGGAPLCFTRPDETSWWKNLKGDAPIEIWLRGQRHTARAEFLSPRSVEALAGLRAFLTRNPGTAELYQVKLDAQRRPDEEDLAREVANSIVVRLRTS